MFKAPFSFNGRIRRTEYGLSFIIAYVTVLGVGLFIGILGDLDDSQLDGISVILSLPMTFFLWAQGAKRCHDIGLSGWYQLIPFFPIYLVFKDGDIYPNMYGVPPKLYPMIRNEDGGTTETIQPPLPPSEQVQSLKENTREEKTISQEINKRLGDDGFYDEKLGIEQNQNSENVVNINNDKEIIAKDSDIARTIIYSDMGHRLRVDYRYRVFQSSELMKSCELDFYVVNIGTKNLNKTEILHSSEEEMALSNHSARSYVPQIVFELISNEKTIELFHDLPNINVDKTSPLMHISANIPCFEKSEDLNIYLTPMRVENKNQ